MPEKFAYFNWGNDCSISHPYRIVSYTMSKLVCINSSVYKVSQNKLKATKREENRGGENNKCTEFGLRMSWIGKSWRKEGKMEI